jgi:hypothetical protein
MIMVTEKPYNPNKNMKRGAGRGKRKRKGISKNENYRA